MRLQFTQRAGSHMAAHAGCAGDLVLPCVCPKYRQVLNILSVHPLMTWCLILQPQVLTSQMLNMLMPSRHTLCPVALGAVGHWCCKACKCLSVGRP